MLQRRVELGKWLTICFDRPRQAIQPAKAFDFFGMAQASGVEGPTQHGQTLVVCFERHRKRMAIFTTMRKRKPRRIRKPGWRSMDYLCNQCERLQSPRPEPFHQQQRCEIAKVLLISNSEYSSQTLQIHIFSAHVMVRRHRQLTHFVQNACTRLVHNCEHRALRLFCARVYQVQNLSLRFANNRSMRIRYEIANRRRVPVISPRQPIFWIHPLLHHSPFARSRNHKRMQIELKSVGNRVIVHACCSLLMRANAFPSRPTIVRARNSSGVRRECFPRPPQTINPSSENRVLRPRFNAPMTDVVIPEECQSMPITAPYAWNQKGSLRRVRNSDRP